MLCNVFHDRLHIAECVQNDIIIEGRFVVNQGLCQPVRFRIGAQ